jgi:hypothetical protein
MDLVFSQMHLLIGRPVETRGEIFAPSSSSPPRLFIGKLGEFINNSNAPCERELGGRMQEEETRRGSRSLQTTRQQFPHRNA